MGCDIPIVIGNEVMEDLVL
ncbi:Protein of unknown function [Bacillus mycoides]|nr:Protein of unknown function [Bacillus mycoides]